MYHPKSVHEFKSFHFNSKSPYVHKFSTPHHTHTTWIQLSSIVKTPNTPYEDAGRCEHQYMKRHQDMEQLPAAPAPALPSGCTVSTWDTKRAMYIREMTIIADGATFSPGCAAAAAAAATPGRSKLPMSTCPRPCPCFGYNRKQIQIQRADGTQSNHP